MDILRQELERKRKEAEQIKGPKKYMRRGEVERILMESHESVENPQEQESKQQVLPRKPENKTSSPTEEKEEEEEEEAALIPGEEVAKRLRELGEPIRLFGESDAQRIKRLRSIESRERFDGQRNDFKKALELTDNQAIDELLRRDESSESLDKQLNQSPGKKQEKEDEEEDELDTRLVSLELLQNDPELTRVLLLVYYKRLAKEWEIWMNERPAEIKQSQQGKLQTALQKQSLEYLKPFFKALKRGTMADDILGRVTEIARYLQEREYQTANDAYMRLSIGNAPWPLGVTMVGIHERTARDRITQSQVAHALNDEKQRKWIQAVKRLMTFAQTKWPPSDLSKLVG